jgi:hypothetical protein
MVALYEPDATDAIFDDGLASAMRQELPLGRAKTEDRVRPYNPMNGLYIRALVVALLGSAATFWYEGHGSLPGARTGDHASSRQGWRASVSSGTKV